MKTAWFRDVLVVAAAVPGAAAIPAQNLFPFPGDAGRSAAGDQSMPTIARRGDRLLVTQADGSTVTRTATTNSRGLASFSTSGGRGTYTLTVTGATKSGFTFDAANSLLTKAITK